MADGMTNGDEARATIGFEDLPYFQDYLKDVLRPRIERALEAVDKALTDAAWRHIISAVASEQGTPEVAAALLRPLLESKLGLRLEARLSARFADGSNAAEQAPTSTPAATSGVDLESDSGMTRAGGLDGPEVLTVRRRPVTNPLVNAVMSSARAAGR